jgi:hypothetical protein
MINFRWFATFRKKYSDTEAKVSFPNESLPVKVLITVGFFRFRWQNDWHFQYIVRNPGTPTVESAFANPSTLLYFLELEGKGEE